MKWLQFKLFKTRDTTPWRAQTTEQKALKPKEKLIHEVALNTVLHHLARNMKQPETLQRSLSLCKSISHRLLPMVRFR